MITIVFDNYPYNPKLKTGFGFACVVESGNKKILFDTGCDGKLLLSNMKKLGFAPEDIDTVILSHYHWDHIDGLFVFIEKNNKVDVYVPVSFPDNFKNEVKRYGASIIEVDESRMIYNGVYSTGELHGSYIGQSLKEQSFICETDQGSVLITGCAHSGIVEIITETQRINGQVYMVMGGFHLHDKTRTVLELIVYNFRKHGVTKVCPCHCTGDNARKLFLKVYGKDCILGGVGTVIDVELSLSI